MGRLYGRLRAGGARQGGKGKGAKKLGAPKQRLHKKSLANYVATYEAMTLAKRINAGVIQRMCFVKAFTQSKET